MIMIRVFIICSALLGLLSCRATDIARTEQILNADKPKDQLVSFVRDKGREYRKQPQRLLEDAAYLQQLWQKLQQNVDDVWGDQGRLPSNNRYVKYGNRYLSQAEVDFQRGVIRVATIDQTQPLQQLQQAIVATLLTSDDPSQTDIFSAAAPATNGVPYLLNQVRDQDGVAIRYSWRANRFAKYLIDNKLQQSQLLQLSNNPMEYWVEFAMNSQHTQLRQQKYAPLVKAAANKYNLTTSLIYAIIETESSFNPFAVSRANAYGLMQVVPATAGKDVYQLVLKRAGMPSKNQLFDPAQNIEIGSAYLHLLQTRYLASVRHWLSRRYSIISAYNGGAGNVYRTFRADREQASAAINRLSPEQLYRALTVQHPRAETRRYLQKVVKAERSYRGQ